MSITTMSDEEWTVKKGTYRTRLGTIIIPLDISPGVAKGLLSRIDAFFSEIRLELSEVQSQKEVVESIIREWERSKATGANETARKLTATRALQEYPNEQGTINMYEVQRQLTTRHAFLQGVLDILNGKQARLITITGVLKLEKDLIPYADLGFGTGRS